MGNPAVPTEIKRKRGTLRQDRIPGELVPVERAALNVPAPSSLRRGGRAEWESTLISCPWIANSDLKALQVQCELIDRRDIIIGQLFGSGAEGQPLDLLLETTTGYAYSNPLLISLLKVEDQLAKWTSLLGKTPSDRARLGVAEVKQISKLDEIAARRREKSLRAPSVTSDPDSETTPPESTTPTAEKTAPPPSPSGAPRRRRV